MRGLLRMLPVVVLAVVLAAVGGVGSAQAQGADKVVGPGESIQKAIYAADPGDTIVVKGVHKEDVVIRKDGIKLRGEDAVIEAPARDKADSPCSKVFGPEGICILGGVNLQNGELIGPRVSDVGVSGFTFRGFEQTEDGTFAIDAPGARDATIVGNRFVGNGSGAIVLGRNVDTTIAKNHIVGDPEGDSEGIVILDDSRNTEILKNDVRGIIEEGHPAIAVEKNSDDTTIAGNDLEGNWLSVFVENSTGAKIVSNDITDSTLVGTVIFDSTGTKIVSNDISRSGETGITIIGQKSQDAKVVGNNISGGAFGMFVANTRGGSIAGNTVRNNCAGMFFQAFPSEPVGGFEVKANTVENNTRSCRTPRFDINTSGIGIALLGARDMEVTGNNISGNVPSGPTRISGGVVVATDPYGRSGTPKPRNNSIIGNNFGRNKPDIFWDKSGTGNRFVANHCNTSVPTSLCN